VRPIPPLAGGASGYSDAYEVSLIDAENQKTALGAVVDPWFMALSILAFTDADTGTTADNGSHIPTYTGYARKSVAGTDMPAATSGSGQAANTSAIIFAACTAGTSTILAFANCVASTVGVLRKWGDCASTVVSTTQTPPQFAVGAYVTSVWLSPPRDPGRRPPSIGTEHTLLDVAVAGTFTLHVDVVNLAALDVVEFRAYQMVLTGGTRRVAYPWALSGAQVADALIWISVPISNELTDAGALRFTLKQTFGTGRNFPWKVLKYA
jgi:hypothetical protein